MQRLEDRYAVPLAGQFTGRSQPGRPAADDGDPFAAGRRQLLFGKLGNVGHGPVGHETLQIADRNRIPLDTADALGFALAFLRTDPAANRWQRVITPQDQRGFDQVFLSQRANEFRNRDTHRAAFHTGAALALDAALRLTYRLIVIQPQVDLLEVAAPHFGIEFGHVNPRYGQPLLDAQFVRSNIQRQLALACGVAGLFLETAIGGEPV